MKITLILSPYYSVMACVAILAYLVGGAIVSSSDYIIKHERRDAVVNFIIEQPLQQLSNIRISEKDL